VFPPKPLVFLWKRNGRNGFKACTTKIRLIIEENSWAFMAAAQDTWRLAIIHLAVVAGFVSLNKFV